MATQVEFTRNGLEDAKALTGRGKKFFNTWLLDLEREGCRAMGYRLTGAPPLDRLCVRHLNSNLRVVVSFDPEGTAWILLVGPHDESSAVNVYGRLMELADITVVPAEERTKPSCCSARGLPPESEAVVQDLVDRCNETVRRRRRQA